MIQVKLEVLPFPIPERIFTKGETIGRGEGYRPNDGHPIAALSKEDLITMCEEFTRSVLKQAGHT